MTDQELQSLRNIGNECEAAADEITRLRAALAAAPQPARVAYEVPALDWPAMLLLLNEYAMHVHDASEHQAESRADISKTAALNTLERIRMALAAHISRWQALALVDIRTLDHVIVAGTRTTSFAERGLL